MLPDNQALTGRFLASRATEDDDTHAVRLLHVTRRVQEAWWYATELHVKVARRPSRRVTVTALSDGRTTWPRDETPACLAAFRGRDGQTWQDVTSEIEAHLSALLAGFDEPARLRWRPRGKGRWQVPLLDRAAGRALTALETFAQPGG